MHHQTVLEFVAVLNNVVIMKVNQTKPQAVYVIMDCELFGVRVHRLSGSQSVVQWSRRLLSVGFR